MTQSAHNDDETPASDETQWHVHTAPLLAVLRQMRAAASDISTLRAGIAELRAELCHEQSPLRGAAPASDADQAQVLALRRAYLLDALAQIHAAHTLHRARYYIDRLIKSLTVERTSRINDLNLNRWKEYDDILTDSLWRVDRRDSSGVHTAGYWGNFIPQIPYQMMRRYTRAGDWVLDTFAGLGTTLIEGQRLGRNVIGIELQPDIADRARELVAAEASQDAPNVVSEIVTGDSTELDYVDLLAQYGRESVQLVMMHPPYYDIIKFSEHTRDLSNAANVAAFLAMLRQVATRAAAVLDSGRFLVLVIGDKYERGEWIPLGFRAMDEILACGFMLKSIVVKNFEDTTGKRHQKELWRYRALLGGFYIFKHEYIFLLQKR
jgi:DNA modification methylase